MSVAEDNRPSGPGPQGTARGWRLTHDAMACTFGVRIAADDERYAEQAARAAFDEVDRLEQLLNRFIPHSDIARINELRAGESVRVALETSDCLQLAATIHDDTHGAFDVAFRGRRRASPAGAAARVNAPLVFDPVSRVVGVQADGVELDLGGIGKGFALDRMAAVLREWRIDAALLDSGQSTVYALGRPNRAGAWRVGLRRPERQEQALETLELCDQALSGSGQRLHGAHIVDPRTGRPAEQHAAAWALAPTAAVSDALSTAFMVMTPAEVAGYCERHGDVGAILLRPAAAGEELLYYGARPRPAEAGGAAS
jgi:thiamine biosynthesis lipoprotein